MPASKQATQKAYCEHCEENFWLSVGEQDGEILVECSCGYREAHEYLSEMRQQLEDNDVDGRSGARGMYQ